MQVPGAPAGLTGRAPLDIILISINNEEAIMPDVLVRDVDESALVRLKERARGNGRSLGSELKLILEQASRTVDMATARAAPRR